MECKLKTNVFKYQESEDLASKTVEFIYNRYGVNVVNKGREKRLIELRALYFKVMLDHTKGESLSSIGESVHKDHATVLHSRKNLDKYFKNNARLLSDYVELCDNVVLKEENQHLVQDSDSVQINKDVVLMLQAKEEEIKKLTSLNHKLVAINMQHQLDIKKIKLSNSRESSELTQLRNELKESRSENRKMWNDFKKSKGIYGKL